MEAYKAELKDKVAQKCKAKGTIFGSVEAQAILEVVAEELHAIKEASEKKTTKTAAKNDKQDEK